MPPYMVPIHVIASICATYARYDMDGHHRLCGEVPIWQEVVAVQDLLGDAPTCSLHSAVLKLVAVVPQFVESSCPKHRLGALLILTRETV